MSLRLLMLSVWMPKGTMVRELLHIEEVTNQALDSLLMERGPARFLGKLENEDNSLDEIRGRMAKGHRLRVDALLRELGRDEGIMRGREALFKVGVGLGAEARARLKMGEGAKDLERAATVLYRILGIDVRMTFSDGEGRMTVSRCSLSPHYSEDTCAVLSATDEGMMSGLAPKVRMQFIEHMTSGRAECIAMIELQEG